MPRLYLLRDVQKPPAETSRAPSTRSQIAVSTTGPHAVLQKLQTRPRYLALTSGDRAGLLLADLLGMALVTVPSADLVIRCAIKVHAELGPGLFEFVYTPCLVHELQKT